MPELPPRSTGQHLAHRLNTPHHKVLVDGRERRWSCGHDAFIERQRAWTILTLGLFALFVSRKAVCVRCGQQHYTPGNISLETRMQQRPG